MNWFVKLKSMGIFVKKNELAVMGMLLCFVAFVTSGCSFNNSFDSQSKDKNVVSITNVSYDPTRELFEDYNAAFATYWKDTTNQEVIITQSHGGSAKQARSVVEGNEADVVTLALAHDITKIESYGLIDEGWIQEFPRNSAPFTSTIVLLVRKGNEKNIHDWDDLVRDGIEVITPNPKTSGGACWNFLAAYAYAIDRWDGDKEQATKFMRTLYQNVSVLDSGARAATTTFVENGQGDVLIAWENEAYLSLREHPNEFEIINPSKSILTQPSVALVDEVTLEHGTKEVSKAYLSYLYSDIGQRIVADHYYRPTKEEILEEYEDVFDLSIELVTIDDFGGWESAYSEFFDDDAMFDQIYAK